MLLKEAIVEPFGIQYYILMFMLWCRKMNKNKEFKYVFELAFAIFNIYVE